MCVYKIMRVNELIIRPQDNILVIAPHPDDESIGVGGLLSLYAEQCEIWVMTDGRYGNAKYFPDEMVGIRKKEFEKALLAVGCKKYKFFEYEDGNLIQYNDCYKNQNFTKYSMIFLPNPSDNHSDHTAVTIYAINELQNKKIRVFLYEVHTPLADITCYVNINDVLNKKKEMVQSYCSQLEIHPYDEQIMTLARFRALQNEQVNCFIETYQELEIENFLQRTTGTEIELAKYKYFTRIMKEWIALKKARSISDILYEKGFDSVAIYGYGMLGKLLLEELESEGHNVMYIVDKNPKILCDGKKVIHDICNMPQVDVVVVTSFGQEQILKEIEDCVGIKTMSMVELFDL